tara:strand:+ start:372 stop:725 length:354 start_codon:yes stop_codon:yes gene_type:complete
MSWRDILKAPLNPREEEWKKFDKRTENWTDEQKYIKLEEDLNYDLVKKMKNVWTIRVHEYKNYFEPNDPEFKLFEEFRNSRNNIQRAKELYEEILKIPASRMENPLYVLYPEGDEGV